MKQQLLALYELQRLDIRIGEINAALAALDGAKELKRGLAVTKAALDTAEKSLAEQELELTDSELKLKSIDEKRVKFEKRLYGGSISNPKELEATEKEIAMLKDQQGKLDSKTLELYDQVDAARTAAQSARKTVADLEKQVEEALAHEATEKKRLESEFKGLTSQRGVAALKITEKSLLARYDTVRKRTGSTGIAKLKDGRCEGCHISIASFQLRKLVEDKESIGCENCGRILLLDIE